MATAATDDALALQRAVSYLRATEVSPKRYAFCDDAGWLIVPERALVRFGGFYPGLEAEYEYWRDDLDTGEWMLLSMDEWKPGDALPTALEETVIL